MKSSSVRMKGADFKDLADCVRAVTEEGPPARIVLQSMCGCRGILFGLEADPIEGCARRTCASCGGQAFLGDSEAHWSGAEPSRCVCSCGGDLFEIAVGFSFREDDEVRGITLGQRCVKCGEMDSPAGWSVDYAPTEHLLERS
jgi:hypothetical protein